MLDNLVFALAFYLLASSIIIVFLLLNMFLDKAFKLHFSAYMLMIINVVGNYSAFIFSQTTYFSNILDVVAPNEVLYPAHWGRVIALGWLSIVSIPAIMFLADVKRNLWKWTIGTLLCTSIIVYFVSFHLIG